MHIDSHLAYGVSHRKCVSCTSGMSGDRQVVSLYAAHALATFCERGWEFAIGLFILEVFPNSLLPVAAYGVAEGLVKMLGGGHAGAWIDRSDRLTAVKKAFALQNVGNALSSAMNWMMIYFTTNNQGFHDHDYVLLVFVILFGSAAAVGNMAAKIADLGEIHGIWPLGAIFAQHGKT